MSALSQHPLAGLQSSRLAAGQPARRRKARRRLAWCKAQQAVEARAAGSESHADSAAPPLPRSLRAREYGALEHSQYPLFVQFFRQASPYIEGHRGRTFVLAIPGEVIDQKDMLYALLEDVALLHGLGAKLVLVIGARMQIDEALRAAGSEPVLVGGRRVTDALALQAAVQAAGSARMEVEARLSKGPTVPMIRRHARGGAPTSYGPALTTVTGNYVAAKRKGVVGGVDYQHTGIVRFVQTDAVRAQLGSGSVVLLSNLGFSASGEVLNCDTYTVACRAAVDLAADKLIVLTVPESLKLPAGRPPLPLWLPLGEAEALLRALAAEKSAPCAEGLGQDLLPPAPAPADAASSGNGSGGGNGGAAASAAPQDIDFDRWYECGLPLPLLAACAACRGGVKRAHLVDARMDGGLLLELYSRDGVGTMISADFYEGIRPATPQDVPGIQELLAPLEERGILVKRSRSQLEAEIPFFTVMEREARLLGCATVRPLAEEGGAGGSAGGVGPGTGVRGGGRARVAELAAFCVHPSYRGSGKGDALLEYLESDARARGIQTLVLLTTRTADWFEQRGFQPAGPAHQSSLLPARRRARIDPARNSQLFAKVL